MFSIEKLICIDHCLGFSSENYPIARAKVYDNWFVRSSALIVNNNASALALAARSTTHLAEFRSIVQISHASSVA